MRRSRLPPLGHAARKQAEARALLVDGFLGERASTVDTLAEECARLLGLQGASAEFRKALGKALRLCLIVHSRDKPTKRISNSRKELMQVSKETAAVAARLRTLHARWTDLEPHLQEKLCEGAAQFGIAPDKLAAEIARFDEVSARARGLAKRLKRLDRGGPPKMVAFDSLVRGLARAFKTATGHDATVTWNTYRNAYEGPFAALMEGVLPVALNLADHFGRPLKCPASPGARGAFIHELTRPGRRKGESPLGHEYRLASIGRGLDNPEKR